MMQWTGRKLFTAVVFVYLTYFTNAEENTSLPENFTTPIPEGESTETTCNFNDTCTTTGDYLTTHLPKVDAKVNATKKKKPKFKHHARKLIPVGNKQICSCNSLVGIYLEIYNHILMYFISEDVLRY